MMSLRRRLLMQMMGGDSGLKLVRTYVVQESWENNTLGIVGVEVRTVLSDLIASSDLENLWVAVYEGNTASQYAADYMAVAGKAGSYQVISSVRDSRTNRAGGGSRSFWASTGTVIKVYQLYE